MARGNISSSQQVYSRFAYKKMIFDVSANGSERYSTHQGSEQTVRYRLPDYLGQGPLTVTSRQTPVSARIQNFTENATFKATYASDKTQLVSYVTGAFDQTPKSRIYQNIEYDSPLFKSGGSSSVSSGNSKGVTLFSDLFQVLPKQWALDVTVAAAYNRTNVPEREYSVGDDEIVNNPTDERSWNLGVNLVAQKCFSSQHVIAPIVAFQQSGNKVDYLENPDNRMTYRNNEAIGMIYYQFNSQKWSVTTSAEWRAMFVNVNHREKSTTSNPSAEVNASFSPNQKHRISATVYFKSEQPSASMINPTMTQLNQLEWIVGNTDLGRQRKVGYSASYLWLCSNKWQVSVNSSYGRILNRWSYTYTPDSPDGTLLVGRANDGHADSGSLSLTATLKLLNSSLILMGRPMLSTYSITAGESQRLTAVDFMISATYYLGQFRFEGFYYTPRKEMRLANGLRTDWPSQCQIMAGWSNGKWNVGVSLINFTKWGSRVNDQKTYMKNQYYEYSAIDRNFDWHAGVHVSATYTFGYGKKVSHDNEGVQTITPSSALDFGK